ncbi:MAG: GNAT family N-acetyltransferase [Pseudomonadota bacterium]
MSAKEEWRTYQAPRVVETARLVLRPFSAADHPAYALITSDADVMRYVGTGVANTSDVAWRSMSMMLGHWEMRGYGLWALTLRDGPLMGHVGFIDVAGWPGFELGWLLGKDYWDKGYAFEAAEAARRIAFEDLKKDRVISLIRDGNAPSIRLAQKMGAQREGEVELMGSAAGLWVHRS